MLLWICLPWLMFLADNDRWPDINKKIENFFLSVCWSVTVLSPTVRLCTQTHTPAQANKHTDARSCGAQSARGHATHTYPVPLHTVHVTLRGPWRRAWRVRLSHFLKEPEIDNTRGRLPLTRCHALFSRRRQIHLTGILPPLTSASPRPHHNLIFYSSGVSMFCDLTRIIELFPFPPFLCLLLHLSPSKPDDFCACDAGNQLLCIVSISQDPSYYCLNRKYTLRIIYIIYVRAQLLPGFTLVSTGH